LQQRQKIFWVLVGCALVLMPWGKVLDLVSTDVSGYYIGSSTVSSGYKVLRLDSSGQGRLYSYDPMKFGILNSYPFTYSSSLLSITVEFDDGNQTTLSQGFWGLEGQLHCTKGDCGGMANVSRIGESVADLPAGFQRALSKINY